MLRPVTLLFLMLLCNCTDGERHQFELHPEFIDLYMHRSTSFALFEAKAKKELAKLPAPDLVVYQDCAKSARTVFGIAKCVAVVLDQRDRMRDEVRRNALREESCDLGDQNDGSWLSVLLQGIFNRWRCPGKAEEKKASKHGGKIAERISFSATSLKAFANPVIGPNRTEKKQNNVRQRFIFGKIERLQNRRLNLEKALTLKRLRQQTTSENTIKLDSKVTSNPIDTKRIRTKKSTIYRRVFKVSKRCKVPKSVNALRKVQNYFDKMNEVIRFSYKIGKENEKFLREMDEQVTFQSRQPRGDSPYEQMKKTLQQLEEFDDEGVVSILSPKLLNLMPSGPRDPNSKHYLSPNMLSFQDEGFLPLPRLLKMSNSDECETLQWLELMLDFTGGSKMLNSHIDRFADHMKTVDERLYPRVKQVEAMEAHYDKVHNTLTEEQRKEMREIGYVPMNQEQMDMVYGKGGVFEKVARPAPDEEPDAQLERLIRSAAALDPERLQEYEWEGVDTGRVAYDSKAEDQPPFRTKRQAKRPPIFDFRDLSPFAFTQRVGNPNFLGHYVLSPYAFYYQAFSPTFLNMEIINPRAFVATVFSPVVLVFRVLSPSAFRLMLFSPLMLVGWVMVPEAFLAKIFSPKLLDARVLSPESFSAIVLSPGAGVARIASPNAMNVIVLSPSFFTYGLYSGNRFVVQVLSPGILGIDAHPLLKPLGANR